MPHRRLTALPLALIATVSLAGCAIELSPESVPLPFSVAPTPSSSAGVPAYVCTAAYQILTEGAVHLGVTMKSSSDSARQDLRDELTGMATKLDREAAGTGDQELKQALSAVAADLNAAATQPDPKTYVNGGFQDVGQKLDGACADS